MGVSCKSVPDHTKEMSLPTNVQMCETYVIMTWSYLLFETQHTTVSLKNIQQPFVKFVKNSIRIRSELLLVTRPNDNRSPGSVIREVSP